MKTNITYRFYTIILMILIAPFISISQPFVDPLNVKYQYFPERAYSSGHENLSSDLCEATLFLPFKLKNKDSLVVIGKAMGMNFNSTGDDPLRTTLYSTSLALGYAPVWKNKNWRTMVTLIPKINSDHEDISSEDFQIGGVIMFNYIKNKYLKYHFGLYYNREFFGDYLIPLVGIEWKITDRMILFGDLPANMNLEYRLHSHFYTGVAFQSVISSYRLTGGDYVREGDNLLGHDQLKLYFNFYPNKHFVVFAEAGKTYHRMYTQYDKDNNAVENSPIFRESEDGIFYSAGFAFRMRFK